MGRKKRSRYVRIATFPVEEVLPYVFTKELRHQLREEGHGYDSPEWKAASRREYTGLVEGKPVHILVSMGSHRYQLFAKKGCACVKCGIVGRWFALERGRNDDPFKFHFNLYGNDPQTGKEVMLTKDHIIPKAKGGKNKLTNYQPMCYRCNQKKADHMP